MVFDFHLGVFSNRYANPGGICPQTKITDKPRKYGHGRRPAPLRDGPPGKINQPPGEICPVGGIGARTGDLRPERTEGQAPSCLPTLAGKRASRGLGNRASGAPL